MDFPPNLKKPSEEHSPALQALGSLLQNLKPWSHTADLPACATTRLGAALLALGLAQLKPQLREGSEQGLRQFAPVQSAMLQQDPRHQPPAKAIPKAHSSSSASMWVVAHEILGYSSQGFALVLTGLPHLISLSCRGIQHPDRPPPFPDMSPFLTEKVPRTPQILHDDLPPCGGIFLIWYRLNKSTFPDSSHHFSLLPTCPTVHQLTWPSGPITGTGGIALLEVAMTEQEQHLYPENYVCSK